MKVRAVLPGMVIATILAMLGALLPQLASAAPEKASGRYLVVATILAMLGALLPQLASAAPEKASGRYLVRARSSADYAALRAKKKKERFFWLALRRRPDGLTASWLWLRPLSRTARPASG